MLQILFEGISLGLATGITCLGTCTPIYLPYLLTEDRKLSKSFMKVMEISLGRFFSYLAFGAAAGFIGKNISSVNREIFTSIAYILLSIYLIFSAYRSHQSHKKCSIPKAMKITKSAFILGILTGINFCPAFLIALSKAVNLGGVTFGMLHFFGFFLGTTVFILPLAFVNLFSKVKGMKTLAKLASLVIAMWFISVGIKGIYHWQQQNKSHNTESREKRIVEVFDSEQAIFLITDEESQNYFQELKESLNSATVETIHTFIFIEKIDWNIVMDTENPMILIDSDLMENELMNNKIGKFDHITIEEGFDIDKLVSFLKVYTFQVSNVLDWKFENTEEGDSHE
ncbi:MAG: sulfite exporter TauE/SafE family protein [Candidatus Cloacimonetes bacterium]|nr:sulfite exporter TauE/SafE family protein [Candidatus Cloacimonadota bacterium]